MANATRSRAPSSFAFLSRSELLRRVRTWLRPAPKRLELGDLSDRLARDIGVSPADLERHRLRLPSQTTYHPRG